MIIDGCALLKRKKIPYVATISINSKRYNHVGSTSWQFLLKIFIYKDVIYH